MNRPLSSLLCWLGLHRWASRVYRLPAVGAAYHVRSCSSCRARRVRMLPAGGES